MNAPSVPRACALACMLLGAAAWSHETWLASDQRTQQPGVELKLSMSSGEHFPTLGTSIAQDRIDQASCRQRADTMPLRPVSRNSKALRLVATPALAEATVCSVQLKPRELDLAANKIALYLDEVDASPALRQAWQDVPSPKRWHETYTKNAKVIVPVRGAPRAPAATEPLGLKLEFVPENDLSAGVVSGPLAARLLLDGKPLQDVSVELLGEQRGTSTRQRSNAQGRVEFQAPGPGRWMLSATDLRLVDAQAGKWESQFSTLVFEVLAPNR